MFKIGSFSDEIMKSMEKQLVSNKVEKTYGLDKLSKAADYLYIAANVFEQAGLYEEASDISEVLEDLLNKMEK